MSRFTHLFGFLLTGFLALAWLSGCAARDRYTGTYINWQSPLLLEDGKIGMFQVMWDEFEVSCGYTSPFYGTCEVPRNVRTHFVTFSPVDSSLDTMFTPLPARYSEPGSGGSFLASATYHDPHILYAYEGTWGLYNRLSGEHRAFPSAREFSRSGRFVTSGIQRVSVETGLPENLTPFPWQIDYYDDETKKVIVFRWSYTPGGPKKQPRVTPMYGVVYDVARGTFDSSRASSSSINFSKRARGTIVVSDAVRVGNSSFKIPYALVEAFDPDARSLDTAVVIAQDYLDDLDPDARVYVYANYSFNDREAGITFGTFDGASTVYRARDFHQGIPPAP